MNFTYRNNLWKGEATNSIVPTNSRPFTNNDPNLTNVARTPMKANPIKHWRKQLQPYYRTPSSKQVSIDHIDNAVYIGSREPDCASTNKQLLKENITLLNDCVGTKIAHSKTSDVIDVYVNNDINYGGWKFYLDASENVQITQFNLENEYKFISLDENYYFYISDTGFQQPSKYVILENDIPSDRVIDNTHDSIDQSRYYGIKMNDGDGDVASFVKVNFNKLTIYDNLYFYSPTPDFSSYGEDSNYNKYNGSDFLGEFKLVGTSKLYLDTAIRCVGGSFNVRRSASTNIKKNYYTSNSKYLQAKCKTYENKQILGTQNDDGTYQSTNCIREMINKCNKPIVYKPSNSNHSHQGAVSASANLLRKRNNVLTNNSASLKNAYGTSYVKAYPHYTDSNSSAYVLRYVKGSTDSTMQCNQLFKTCSNST